MKESLNKESKEYWEKRLASFGMPSQIKTEAEIAQEAGIELISAELATLEAQALAEKLKQEDNRNILGGFPNTIEDLISLVKTLQEEWQEKNIQRKDIQLIIHSSCVNGSDCVTLTHNGGNVYHYNTKHIRGYSREKISSILNTHGLSFIEK